MVASHGERGGAAGVAEQSWWCGWWRLLEVRSSSNGGKDRTHTQPGRRTGGIEEAKWSFAWLVL